MSWSYNPVIAETTTVWTNPISLAATIGITFVFSSTGYLDVSVPRVRLLKGYYVFNIVGCPIRISMDHIVCADPHGFSQLITSFIASESLGIPHTPFSSLSPNLQILPYSIILYTLYLKNSCLILLYKTFNSQILQHPCGYYKSVPICQ